MSESFFLEGTVIFKCTCQYNKVNLIHIDTNEMHFENLDGNNVRMLCVLLKKSKINSSQNNTCMAIYLPSQKSSKSDEQDILGIAEETRMNS